MSGAMLDEKWLASAEYGPAVLRLRLLEVQLILDKANVSLDIRERARQVAFDLRQAIADRPCVSRADVSAKLSLLLDKTGADRAAAPDCGSEFFSNVIPETRGDALSANHFKAA